MSTKAIARNPFRWPHALLHLFVAILIGGTGAAWAQGELFVANGNGGVAVYSRTANGNVAPVRTITGAATGFNGVTGVAPDRVHNELAVSNCNPGSVLVFPLA